MAVKQQGMIVCAYCTCMAGLDEACTHIAALLFSVEASTQVKKWMSCTSLPCSWLPPSFRSVPYAQLADTDFSTPQLKRKKDDYPTSSSSGECSRITTVTTKTPSAEKLNSLYTKLSKVWKPAILSLEPEFCDSHVPLCKEVLFLNP